MSFLYTPSEYLRPWKLFSLAAGIALLVLGSIHMPSPDWDMPISFIMALPACSCCSTLSRENSSGYYQGYGYDSYATYNVRGCSFKRDR